MNLEQAFEELRQPSSCGWIEVQNKSDEVYFHYLLALDVILSSFKAMDLILLKKDALNEKAIVDFRQEQAAWNHGGIDFWFLWIKDKNIARAIY